MLIAALRMRLMHQTMTKQQMQLAALLTSTLMLTARSSPRTRLRA